MKFILLPLTFLIMQYTIAQTFSTPVLPINPNIGTGGNVGKYSSLQIVNGNPAMCYLDGTRSDLVYVRATDATGTT